MKKYNIKNVAFYFLLTLLITVYSCSVNEDYKKFVEGGEISYTGKMDSLKIYPGLNRIKLEGLLLADPKIVEVRVYWNNFKDSVSFPVVRTADITKFSELIPNLPENVYNFQVKTFDKKGNSSLAVSKSAEVYGERYINSLVNRPIVKNVLIGNELTIEFANFEAAGLVSSTIEYTSASDEVKTVVVDATTQTKVITDFKSGSSYQFRTGYKPVPNAIDVFYTPDATVKPKPTPVLKNAKMPFAYTSISGRWGILKDWNTNDAMKNHGCYGGYDGGCCGKDNVATMNFESGWGAPAIVNGKVYQTVTAEPATYQLKVKVWEANYDINDPGGTYFVVATGDGLPNVENLKTAPEVLGYKRVLSANQSIIEYIVEFTVTQTSTISVGVLSSQPDWGRYGTYKGFEIVVVK